MKHIVVTKHKGLEVGQGIVFTDDTGKRGGYGDEPWPTVGRVYHIREIHTVTTSIGKRFSWCLLQEITGPTHRYNIGHADDFETLICEAPWCLSRFRAATQAEIEQCVS